VQAKGQGQHSRRRGRRVPGGVAHCRGWLAARHEIALKAFSNLLKDGLAVAT
jgi:hypothetical protein